ncbi:MAG: 4Fe-4S dicluster domain-containing protein [Deltaproteobacteria bacterium]|nr:4Fe-4S dicluster domain-containing protein [Deltaproteobacteria bacterium]MBW2051214.1 4Fe-4S dicluster domain-containing protein [Deltaproteobacteria bacterium]MBW2139855.1 4Fe-4S dicluster domain-containing protein [Deltaproteobacteria bacterium]MBW2322019.1 4Fe-4S dicluster domain-containing protein [Deltaproteobacteria bacterium]
MSVKVDPNLMKDLKEFGLTDANKCFHCGNCTAVCPLSTPENPFPRKLVKYAQMGLKDKILQSPEPWLCYYCGDCSDTCPRGADPGETMMVMRRYLTSLYDWTGFSRKFYTSEKFEIIAVVVLGLLVALGLWIFHADSPNMEHAYINSVWPVESMEIADLIMGGVLAILLLSNTARCFLFVLGDLKSKIPIKHYIAEAKELVIHLFTQKQFSECTDRMQWIVHLLIMTGYSTVFLMVVVFLAGGLDIIGLSWEKIRFQRDVIYPIWHPMRLLGYYATAAILYGTTYAIIGRIKKSKAPYKNSHGTDWMFLILLQLTTLTGIFIHFTRLLDWPLTTYVLYAIHLGVAVPMLVLEVPFAKWAHLAYRPVVLYLTKVKERYAREQQAIAS